MRAATPAPAEPATPATSEPVTPATSELATPGEPAASVACRNCGDPVDPRRAQLGYDYCTKQQCQDRCIDRVRLASIGVNKAADYYTTADELLPPRQSPRPATVAPDEEESEGGASRARAVKYADPRRPDSTIERLHRAEAALDDALEKSYAAFSRGEITAAEMKRDRRKLIEEFNALVRAGNIRYRSLIRPV